MPAGDASIIPEHDKGFATTGQALPNSWLRKNP
jgi:hypothetical protein